MTESAVSNFDRLSCMSAGRVAKSEFDRDQERGERGECSFAVSAARLALRVTLQLSFPFKIYISVNRVALCVILCKVACEKCWIQIIYYQ